MYSKTSLNISKHALLFEVCFLQSKCNEVMHRYYIEHHT